jgi:hypothetical protein
LTLSRFDCIQYIYIVYIPCWVSASSSASASASDRPTASLFVAVPVIKIRHRSWKEAALGASLV